MAKLPNLSKLSDDELAATILLLGEQAQEISDATACVRRELQSRAAPVDPGGSLSAGGFAALAMAVTDAPERAKEIAAAEAARVAEEAAQAEADNG